MLNCFIFVSIVRARSMRQSYQFLPKGKPSRRRWRPQRNVAIFALCVLLSCQPKNPCMLASWYFWCCHFFTTLWVRTIPPFFSLACTLQFICFVPLWLFPVRLCFTKRSNLNKKNVSNRAKQNKKKATDDEKSFWMNESGIMGRTHQKRRFTQFRVHVYASR